MATSGIRISQRWHFMYKCKSRRQPAAQNVTKAANRQNKFYQEKLLFEATAIPRRKKRCVLMDAGVKNLLRKVFCLTAQLSPLEYPHTLRGRVACLGGFIDICRWIKRVVVKMQKPQATCGFASKEKERKNEKGDIRRYATIIQGKCEDYKWKVFTKVLSCAKFQENLLCPAGMLYIF